MRGLTTLLPPVLTDAGEVIFLDGRAPFTIAVDSLSTTVLPPSGTGGSLPTSTAGLPPGSYWNNGGFVCIV